MYATLPCLTNDVQRKAETENEKEPKRRSTKASSSKTSEPVILAPDSEPETEIIELSTKRNLDRNELVFMRAERDKAFIGFGITNFVAQRILPDGPLITLQKLNPREVTVATQSKLKATLSSADKPYERLDRFSSTHAITMAVNPAIIDSSTVLKDPAAPGYNTVEWIGDALHSSVLLLNGNNRRLILRSIFDKKWREYQRIAKQITGGKAAQGGNAAYNKAITQRQQLEEQLTKDMCWLVKFYDEGEYLR